MTDLPEWVKALPLAGKIKHDNPEPYVIRLRGSHKDARTGAIDLAIAIGLDEAIPLGYCLNNVKGKVEHKRGGRFTWQVVWITNKEAERRYQDKQAARMSRYEVQT